MQPIEAKPDAQRVGALLMDWCRLWNDMPTDPKWRAIARRCGQRIGDVIAVYVHMMTQANAARERGCIDTWDDEDIAAALDMEPDAVTAIREAMQGKVLDGNCLTGWDNRQPKREDNSAERVKRYRERETQRNDDVTQRNAPDTDTDTEDSPPCVPPRRSTGTRLPKDWQPSPSDVAEAEKEGLSADDIRREAAKFRDYWHAKTGKDATKLDWSATWRNWVRRSNESRAPPQRKPIDVNRLLEETDATR